LFAANGTVINVVGEVVMNVKIGELVLQTRFVVSDNITKPMLGVDWLRSIRMIWDFAKDILLINGKVFHLIPGEKSDSCRRVVATEKVILPARSQAIVPSRVEMMRMTSDAKDGHSVWTTEVSELRNGVNVAHAILPERLDNLPILVLNSSDQPCKIHADTILTELSLAQCTDENDEEILTSLVGDQSYLHLSKLLDGIDNDVSEDQRCELIKMLRECEWVLECVFQRRVRLGRNVPSGAPNRCLGCEAHAPGSLEATTPSTRQNRWECSGHVESRRDRTQL